MSTSQHILTQKLICHCVMIAVVMLPNTHAECLLYFADEIMQIQFCAYCWDEQIR